MNENDMRRRLQELYDEAQNRVSNNIQPSLTSDEIRNLEVIMQNAESSKGVLTVLLTSIFYKLIAPEQDIRSHQSGLPNGYSGRSFDSRYITPFLKEKQFPAMAESGWLTRSLEQNSPYTLDYRGMITPAPLKHAFLEILDSVQKGADCSEYIVFLFTGLLLLRDKQSIRLAKPSNIPIETIIKYMSAHFNANYSASGAARLPVVAFYSIYECFMGELDRFKDKQLLSLESHTSADSQSGRVGDIQVNDENRRVFEGVEIKHGIKITLGILGDAFAKFQTEPVQRYYILSTAAIDPNEEKNILIEIERIKDIHGCQVIVNGVIDSLKYYLRLLNNPADFIERYVINLEKDGALKFEHKERWNQIVGGNY